MMGFSYKSVVRWWGVVCMVGVSGAAFAQVSLTPGNTTYSDNFTGFLGSADPSNWTTVDVASTSVWQGSGTGTGTAGGKYSFGNTGSGATFDGSLGFLPSSTRAINADIVFVNNTGAELTGFDISYVAEHWRSALDGRNNGWAVSYRINGGSFVNIPSLTYVAPNTIATGGGPHGSEVLMETENVTIAAGDEVTIRFFGDNGTGGGNRQGVAIDDFAIEFFEGTPSDPDPEPTNHPTAFSCTLSGSSSIDLSWTDATGTQPPTGYLIRWSDVGYGDISDPADGSPVADGPNALNVGQGVGSATATGLVPNTLYYFKVFPYTNAGSDINYKTDGAVGQTDCETEDGLCVNESFTNMPGNSNAYQTRSWTGDDGFVWSATDARTDQTINGRAITVRDGVLSAENIAGGIADLTITTQRKFNGGSNVLILSVNGINVGAIPYSESVQTTTISGILFGGPFDLEISTPGNGDRVAIDDLSWTCYDGCTATQFITSFSPSSGPAGTLITIVGTGFTGSTAVSIGGQPAVSFTVIDDNTITAHLAQNAITGKVTVTKDGCPRSPTSDFVVLDNNGNCGGAAGSGGFASDLFISEVYDAASGSLGYIEIFNGTPNDVDLDSDNYVVRINTGSVYDFPLSGVLASGDTYIVRIGSSPSSCGGFSADLSDSGADGFNGDDQIFLRKNGANLDYAPNPNHPAAGGTGSPDPGFSQIRNGSVTGPTITYNAAEWNIFGTENCDNLGIAPYSLGGNSIDITAHPEDVDCTALSFSVSATSSSGFPGTGAFTWRYHAPGESGWSLVSELNGINGITVTGANTPNIAISGPVAAFLDYQFYVDIGASGSPQCRRYSNTARFTYDTRAFYRTKGSGDWTSAAIWEMSDTEMGTYVDACTYPVADNSAHITVRDGHSISANQFRFSVDRLIIEEGGDLTVGGSVTGLTVLNGNAAGTDFEINGTYTDGMLMGFGNGMGFSNGATWQMGSNGTVVKTNTSSTTVYRDNYEGGIANIPPSSSWIYRRLSADVQIGTVAANMTYPNLIFENLAGTVWDMNTGPQALTGASPMEILSDLTIGETGSGIVVYNNMTNAAPIPVGGTLLIGFTSTLTNQPFESTAQAGTGFEILGNLEINGTLELSASGTSPQRGQLLVSGITDQDVFGSSVFTINQLVVNKSSGNVFSNMILSVEEEIQLIAGIIDFKREGSGRLELQDGGIIIGGSEASFVSGSLRKTGFEADVAFEFPVGDYREVAIDSLVSVYNPSFVTTTSTAPAVSFESEYFHENFNSSYTNPNNPPPADPSLNLVSTCNYWNIDKIPETSPVQANVGLSWGGGECIDIADPEQLVVSRFNGFEWDNLALFQGQGNTNAGGPDFSSGTVFTTIAFDAFSPFTIGSAGPALNVLPITLLSFTAEVTDGGQVLTRWETASEVNNDFFTVERSADGTTWEGVGQVPGAGNSQSVRSYAYTDDAPYGGRSYYRLRQTDFDGTTATSEVRTVFIGGDSGFALHKVYRGAQYVELEFAAQAEVLTAEVYDLTGRLLHSQRVANQGGRAQVAAQLARGVYVVRLSDGAQSAAMRFFY